MSKTPYEQDKAKFSLWVHENFAKPKIYPEIFPDCEILIEHQNGNEADLKGKIDVIVTVINNKFKEPFRFTVQERWRKMIYSQYEDITITEFNNISGKASEFYEGKMQFFLYGYFDELKRQFGKVIFVNFSSLMRHVAIEAIKPGSELNDKEQDFKTISFSDLINNYGCLVWSNFHSQTEQPAFYEAIDTGQINFSEPELPMEADYWRRLFFTEREKRI